MNVLLKNNEKKEEHYSVWHKKNTYGLCLTYRICDEWCSVGLAGFLNPWDGELLVVSFTLSICNWVVRSPMDELTRVLNSCSKACCDFIYSFIFCWSVSRLSIDAFRDFAKSLMAEVSSNLTFYMIMLLTAWDSKDEWVISINVLMLLALSTLILWISL